jgi:hypothetical protein
MIINPLQYLILSLFYLGTVLGAQTLCTDKEQLPSLIKTSTIVKSEKDGAALPSLTSQDILNTYVTDALTTSFAFIPPKTEPVRELQGD